MKKEKVQIYLPESNTEIKMNVADMSVEKAADYLVKAAWMLRQIVTNSEYFFRTEDGGYCIAYERECDSDDVEPFIIFSHDEWEGGEKTKFMTSQIFSGYLKKSSTKGRQALFVRVDKDFAEFAQTEKPLSEFFRNRASKLREALDDKEE